MNSPIRRRTRARELALQFLYTIEIRGTEAMDDLPEFAKHHSKGVGSAKDRREISAYLNDLCHGVYDHYADLNDWIEAIARNWKLERMALIDRNILRMAIYELLFSTEVPFKVVINEAIDVAKRFSGPQSGGFVNGILDRARIIIQEARENGEEIPAPPVGDISAAAPLPETEKVAPKVDEIIKGEETTTAWESPPERAPVEADPVADAAAAPARRRRRRRTDPSEAPQLAEDNFDEMAQPSMPSDYDLVTDDAVVGSADTESADSTESLASAKFDLPSEE
jgi:transcription antitermination protein NusB